VNLEGLKWRGIRSIRLANPFRAKNTPSGFAEWARKQGSVFVKDDDQR
jgi:hypothetical protein